MHKTKGDCCSVRLVRLKIGERIEVDDYCFDNRQSIGSEKVIWQDPVQVIETDQYSIISRSHHPHFRIVKSQIRRIVKKK